MLEDKLEIKNSWGPSLKGNPHTFKRFTIGTLPNSHSKVQRKIPYALGRAKVAS